MNPTLWETHIPCRISSLANPQPNLIVLGKSFFSSSSFSCVLYPKALPLFFKSIKWINSVLTQLLYYKMDSIYCVRKISNSPSKFWNGLFLNLGTQLTKEITHSSKLKIVQTWWRWKDHSKIFPTIYWTTPNTSLSRIYGHFNFTETSL